MYNTNKKIIGEIALDGDKSIAHRILMMASFIPETSIIYNVPNCLDVNSTKNCLKECGISIKPHFHLIPSLEVKGGTFRNPEKPLDCGNSGSTLRMMLGLFAANGLTGKFIGDESLCRRPMKRIINPLIQMGVSIESNNFKLPISIESNVEKALSLNKKINSAQVKSSLMLAALAMEEYSKIPYDIDTRNHMELIYNFLDLNFRSTENIYVKKSKFKKGFRTQIPGDISNAAFLIAAVLLIPGSSIKINNVLYNKTRFGFIDLLIDMGANIKIDNIDDRHYEKMCTITAQYTENLKGNIEINKNNIMRMIDEIPILCILATQLEGMTVIKDAKELRIKESDRIGAVFENLFKMGCDIEEFEDGLIIKGGKKLYSTNINSFGDHRIAISFEILNFLIEGKMTYSFEKIIDVSFPKFYEYMDHFIK